MAFNMKGFKAHNMFKTKKANTYQKHLDLEKKGYDHSPYNKYGKSVMKKYKSDAQRKAVHASKAESAMKKPLVGNQDQLPENLKKEILASPMTKKVSWKYGKGTYSGDLIPSMETKTHRYARTHNNKIKSLPKKK